jgi:hypothetical protein
MQLRHIPREALRHVRSVFEAAYIRHRRMTRGRPHTLPGRLVVSLTSYPPRFPTLDLTLRGLLGQDMAPDGVVLWIAHADRAQVPRRVEALQAHGLTIRTCDDLKSYKSSVPSLMAYPDAFILVAGDDVQYPKRWVRCFCECYRHPREVLSQGARRIAMNGSGPAPYIQWTRLTHAADGEGIFPVGRGGTLYPPNCLSPEATDMGKAMNLCPWGDDIWLYWMARRAETTHRMLAPAGKIRDWPGTGASSLWHTRNRDGGNDAQIAAMVATYGWPGAPTEAPAVALQSA